MKVYLAARYPRRNELRNTAKVLEAKGIGVTSRWLYETAPLTSQLPNMTATKNLTAAIHDRDDIDKADAIVLFTEDPLVGFPRGSRHAEFGYAMGKGKRLIIIGGPENIFHYLPEVIHYKSLGDFIETEGETYATI